MRTILISALLLACGPPASAKEAAAEGAYLAEHLRCVDTYGTNAEIDACRARVRERWGIVERVRDAGADR